MRTKLVGARLVGAVGTVAITFLLLLAACSADDTASQFGPVVGSIDEIVGTDLKANGVVAMPCIPSRSDPVGVWLGLRVLDAAVDDDGVTLDLEETDARLGSHPSGCRNPETLLGQSVFLVDGDDLVFAASESTIAGVTSLGFSLGGRSPSDFDVVILPTFEFEIADGTRQTTIFGLIGRYSLSERT